MVKQYAQPGFLRPADGPVFDSAQGTAIKKAAVLIPMLQQQDEWHVLFIRRAERPGDRHSGQVAFPGGKQDPDDPSISHTALREAEEEIGLDISRVDVRGQLAPYHTVSNFSVYPFVSIIPWPQKLIPQESEVARIFTIPLRWLQDEQNYYLKTPEPRPHDFPGPPRRHPVVYYKRFENELLWGATARMTLGLLQALDEGTVRIG
ncbi:MAG: CoA pyrophosphatase [Gammaproteobacteria bacterium]|nr:CoA pyrophosphatase [Gammaproteobacteria bacterium]